MLIVCVFLILAILSFRSESKKIDEAIIIFALCIVSIILAHRASDFPVYRDYFLRVEPLHKVLMGQNQVFLYDKKDYELGYRIINSFIRIFTDHIEFVYIILTIYILLTVYKLFVERSSNVFKLLMPYFIFMLITVQVGIIRQMIAISIFLYSIRYIRDRQLSKFLICSILAFCFHRTAFIFPLFYLFAYREYSALFLISLFCVGILIFLQVIPFGPVSILEKMSNYISNPSIHIKLGYYIWQTKNLPVPARLNRGIFENVGFFFLLLYMRKNLQKKQLFDRFTNICFNLAIIYIFIYIYFFEISSFSYRLNYYLLIFKFFVLVKFIENLEIKHNRLILNSVLVIYCTMMMIIRIGQGF
jgi:hypothetical protein